MNLLWTRNRKRSFEKKDSENYRRLNQKKRFDREEKRFKKEAKEKRGEAEVK